MRSGIKQELLAAAVVFSLALPAAGITIAASRAEPVISENISTPSDYSEDNDSEMAAASEGDIMLASSMVDWKKHSWSAYYDGKNLIFAFDIDFYATGNGTDRFAPKYIFGSTNDPTVTRTPSNILSATTGLADRTRSLYGKVNLTEFSCKSSTNAYERRLKMKGTVTINSSRLSAIKSSAAFRYYAGGWKDGDWAAAENGNFTVANYSTAINQALCSHSSYKYISNGSSGHTKKCSSCAYSAAEAHTLSNGKCSKCSYVSTVSVTLSYVLNGRKETEKLTLTPGAKYQPKSIKGYKTPAQITVPAAGGTVTVNYVPISYKITDGNKTYNLKYDDSLLIPEAVRKGYIQSNYTVTQVS